MKHIYFIIAFLIVVVTISCNNNKRHKISDYDNIYESLYSMLYTNPDSVIKTITEHKTEDSTLYYRLNNILSRAYYVKGNLNEAIRTNDITIDYCNSNTKNENIKDILSESYNNKGVYYNTINKKDSALVYYLKSYALLKDTNKSKLADICINIADNYHLSGNYTMASYWYRKALLTTDSTDIKGYELPIYSGLAKIYLELGNYSVSNQYFKLAEQYISTCKPYEKFYFYNSRGNYYYYTREYEKALGWFRKAYDIIPENLCRMISSCNLGEVYLYLDNTDSAQYYIDNARDIEKEINDDSSRYYIQGLYVYLELKKNDLDKAQEILNRMSSSYRNVSPEYIYLQNKRLHEYYKAKHDYRQAYEYQQKVLNYDDSLRNYRIINSIAETEFRYKTDTIISNKNRTILESEKRISTLKYTVTTSVLVIIIIVITFLYIILLKQKKQEKARQELISTLNRSKVESIKNRISPHYIFNVINALMPGIRSHKELEHPIRCMIRLLRSGISASNNMTVPLSKEIEYVNDYATLYNLYNDNTPEIEWHIDENIDLDNQLIPTMIIQMPVENALKYAFHNIEHPTLKIFIRNINGVEITIADNGVGYTEKNNDKSKGTGTGIKTINDMLNILNRGKSEHIEFEISSSTNGKGTKIRIFIPETFNFEIK